MCLSINANKHCFQDDQYSVLIILSTEGSWKDEPSCRFYIVKNLPLFFHLYGQENIPMAWQNNKRKTSVTCSVFMAVQQVLAEKTQPHTSRSKRKTLHIIKVSQPSQSPVCKRRSHWFGAGRGTVTGYDSQLCIQGNLKTGSTTETQI